MSPWDHAHDYDDWPFCECGVTLLDGEDECPTCAESPHGHECDCHECADYWHEIAEQSRTAAETANRALVCSCGWTGAFIEHHNSEAYGATARTGCVMTFRDPECDASLPKRWTGTEWAPDCSWKAVKARRAMQDSVAPRGTQRGSDA